MTDESNCGKAEHPEIIVKETKSTGMNILFENVYETRAAYQETIKDKPLVSILVIGYNNLQKHTQYCVESILKYTADIDYELVLLDNGSSDGTLEYFKSVPYQKKKIVRVTNNKGGNFGVHLGTQYLTGRYVVMIANDVYVTKNWLSNIIKCAESDERIGFVATASDYISNLQKVNLTFDSLDEMQLKAEQYNVSDPRKWEERLRLMPAIAFYKRECLDIVGSLDYAFQHDFSDDDISIRIRRAGYKIVFCGDVFVHHVGPTVTGSSSENKMALLTTGRIVFRQKYFGVDAWEDVNNFEQLMLDLVNPEEKRGIRPEVLGVDVMCGTPILQLKNKLRHADIFDANLSAFVQDPKYWLDLKTICEGAVAVDRIEYIMEHFSPKNFDYILLGKPINSYQQTDKILSDLLSLLKSKGQLFIKIHNHFDAKAFLGSMGKDIGGGHKTVSSSYINDLNKLLMRDGYSIQAVRMMLHHIDDATKEAIRKVLRNDNIAQNIDAVFNELIAEEYALKITQGAVNRVEPRADKSCSIQITSSNNEITMPTDSSKPDAAISREDHFFPCFRQAQAVPEMTSIVILTCNRLDHTKKSVNTIRKHTPEPHEIIFVDNGSTDGTVKWLHRQVKENKNHLLIENKENVGVAKGRNQGIELSQGEFVLLLDNDAVVCKGWLSGMQECLKRAANAGIVGPMTNNGAGLQRVMDESYQSVDYLDKYAAKFKEQYRHRQITCRNIAGCCMLFKRDLMEKIGCFDERFGTGRFEDEDFSLRVALAGFQNYIAGDVFIHHGDGQRSHGDRKLIEKKWTISLASPEGKKLAVLRATEVADELYRKGKTDEAVEALINCIKLTPEAKEIYCALAGMFIETRRFPEAWEVIESMPEAVINNLKALECAGYAKEGLGLDAEAAAYADRMLSQKGNYPPALNLQGVLAYKKGDKENAADYFKKAIAADPGYGEAYTNLGVLSWGFDKTQEALAYFKRGFILSPTVPDTGSLYYSVISSLGRFSDTEADFRQAAMLYPNHKNLAFLYIDLLIQQGKYDLAMIKIEDALALFGLDEGMLKAALAVREKIGPLQVKEAPEKSTLSLCMIVKNEERHLVKCLKSVRDIVDEMIVVDTGSTDKTKEIAAVFGAKVFDLPWTGDFSAARNHSLAQATCDWILILDADEVIAVRDFGELKKLIRKGASSPAAYSIVTRNYTSNVSVIGWTRNQGQYPEEAGAGWVASAKVRLYTRRANVFFSDPVHEMLEHTLRKEDIPIQPCKIVIHHYGKLDMDKDSQKGVDYYLLGKMKHASDPTNIQYLNELAKQAQVLDKYEEAVELWLKLLALIEGKPDSSSYREMSRLSFGDPVSEIYIQLASVYLMMDRYEGALKAARKAMEAKIKLKEYVHIYAHCEMIVGSLEKALSALEELLKTTPDYTPALFLRGVIFHLEGKKEKAREIFKSLLEKKVQIIPALHKLAEQLDTHGKKDEALLLNDVASATII